MAGVKNTAERDPTWRRPARRARTTRWRAGLVLAGALEQLATPAVPDRVADQPAHLSCRRRHDHHQRQVELPLAGRHAGRPSAVAPMTGTPAHDAATATNSATYSHQVPAMSAVARVVHGQRPTLSGRAGPGPAGPAAEWPSRRRRRVGGAAAPPPGVPRSRRGERCPTIATSRPTTADPAWEDPLLRQRLTVHGDAEDHAREEGHGVARRHGRRQDAGLERRLLQREPAHGAERISTYTDQLLSRPRTPPPSSVTKVFVTAACSP